MNEDITLTRDVETGDLKVPVGSRDHVQGPDTAPVTLVEYADYECPYSRRAHHVIKGLQPEMGDRFRLVYRNFPLRDIHPHAQHAAEAAETAGAQGKFWEMHDFLFEHERPLDDIHLRKYGAEIGLDNDRFDEEMARHIHAARIEEDLEGGLQNGVTGTPTFFVNGMRVEGVLDRKALLAILAEYEAP